MNDLTRLEFLYLILRYCSECGRYLTTGERICINQERAKLMQDDYDLENHVFEHSKIIKTKIDFIATKITNSGWQPEII